MMIKRGWSGLEDMSVAGVYGTDQSHIITNQSVIQSDS